MMERTPVRLSLLRRIAWAGGDRRLVGVSGMLAISLGWTMFNGFGIFFGLFVIVPAALFSGALWVARQMYKADPWMIDVLLRHFKYAKYFAPKTSIGKEIPAIRDFS
jgi:type IV secretory pathway TrbD component